MEEHTRKSSSDTSPAECNWKNGKEKRRTSILKPPKLRTPLKDLQLTSTQEVKDDTTARPSRRVSFGHFQIRKFGYENGDVCDSIYSIESSKSESSSQANNSFGEYNEVPATNSSHKKDPHIKKNATKYKCSETDDKSSFIDIDVSSLKVMALKQIPDDSLGFSAIDTVPHEMQSVHEQGDVKQLHSLTECGREQCEQKNETEAQHCEHHLNSATVTDMELADSYSFGHIECKEESLDRKRKKSVDIFEKSFRFAAESNMELTKVIDHIYCQEVLNEEKDISLNKSRARNNLISSSDYHISKNAKDCNPIKNVNQQLNATKRFSTNNGMDITEGCGLIDSCSLSDIPNDNMAEEVNSRALSISRLSMDEEDGDRNKEKVSRYSTKYLNPVDFFEKSFINESMEDTVAVGCVWSESDTDYRDTIKDFERNKSVSNQLGYSNDNLLPINGEKCSSDRAVSTLPDDDKLTDPIENCIKNNPEDTNNFNTSKTMLMCVDMQLTQNTCHNDQDNSFMQFTRVVEGKIHDTSTQDSLISLGNKLGSYTENFNSEKNNESLMEKSKLKHDVDMQNTCHNDRDNSIMQFTRVVEAKIQDRSTQESLTSPGNKLGSYTEHFNSEKKNESLMEKSKLKHDLDMQNTCHNDRDNSIMQFTSVVEANIQDRSTQDSLTSPGNKLGSYTENFNSEKKNESLMEKSKLKHDMDFTETQSPFCDNGSVAEVVVAERQTDVSITATSSKIILCKDKQNDFVSSQFLDTKSNHPLILKPCVNKMDSSDYALSEKNNHAIYCKERFHEGSIGKKECSHDKSIKCNSLSQTLDKYLEICTVSSTSPELKSEVIQQEKQVNDVGENMCRAQNNCYVIQDTIEACVAPISETKDIPNNRDRTSKILLKNSECQPYCSNSSELHCSPARAVEDHLVTDNKTQCALGSEMLSKKRRSAENDEIKEGTKFRKMQYTATDHISDKQHLQTTTEHSGLAVETKAFSDRAAIIALGSNSGAMDTVLSETPTPKIVGALSDTNSVQVNNESALLKTDITNVSLPQPSDPSNKRNFSSPAKAIVSNNLNDCGLEFICDTSSPSIEAADCKNNLCGRTLVTDKRNKSSPIPEIEVFKKITNDGDIIDKNKTSGQKKYTTYSESVSCTTGTPTNISEVNLPCALLEEDRNSQHIEYSGDLHRNPSALIDVDKNNPFSTPERNDHLTVTFRRRRRYESTVASPSFMERDNEIGDYCSETDKKNCKSVVTDNPELSRDTGGTVALSKSRYDGSLMSVEEGQTVEGIEILNSSKSECSFRKAIDRADKKFHSWYCEKNSSIVIDDTALPADKMNVSNHNTSVTSESLPTQAPEEANKDHQCDYLSSMNKEVGQNMTQDNNSLSSQMNERYLSTEVQLAQVKQKISDVQVDCVSDCLVKNRENISFSVSSVISSCDTECLKQYVQENRNSTFGKKMENKQFSYNDPVKRPDVHVDVQNVTSETNKSQDPKGKCHAISNLTEASQPMEARQPMDSRHCSGSVSTTRDHTSTAGISKIRMSVCGIEDMSSSPILCGGRQNSKCDSFTNEVAVHSEALNTATKKMGNIAGKQEITVDKAQEERQTIPVENKWKMIENIIISKAERSEAVWNIRTMTQCQWIFTFLNDTLRLYFHFDKPSEEGTIQKINFISYLTGKADEDAKFVHFVLLKKFSQAKLKALCKDIEEVPELLEKISVDVERMVTFLEEFQNDQLLYNMELSGTSVSFDIRSYKLVIWFKVTIDLSNWEQILEDSITITQKYGHVNETEVKDLAQGVEKNPYFLRNYYKALRQYMKILERFGC